MAVTQKSTSKKPPKVALLALPRGFYGTVKQGKPRRPVNHRPMPGAQTEDLLEEGLESWNDYVDANPLPLASVRMF
ncbi:hypothetical protein [Paraburkholderia sp. A3RO-2L]|uniref:hypothetical protein n=1 Tax=unclassified Paraburkholderia TaxID=2615204 RepID=UPI003DA9A97B